MGSSILDSVLFLLNFIFFSKRSIDSLTLKCLNSLQSKNNKKATHGFAPTSLWFLSCKKKFENPIISVWVGALQKLTWRQPFELIRWKFWVCHFYSIVKPNLLHLISAELFLRINCHKSSICCQLINLICLFKPTIVLLKISECLF